jgi:hypothetical protein
VVGLSATLPNYIDVATFLRVNPYVGLFFFDGRFRPVPLAQTFIGIKQVNQMRQRQDMDEVCYEKVVEFMRAGHQVMVFVHARNATVNTAMVLKEMAQQVGKILFSVYTYERFLGNCATKKVLCGVLFAKVRCGTVPFFSLFRMVTLGCSRQKTAASWAWPRLQCSAPATGSSRSSSLLALVRWTWKSGACSSY